MGTGAGRFSLVTTLMDFATHRERGRAGSDMPCRGHPGGGPGSATGATERLNLAGVGVRSRGNSLASGFAERKDCRVTYLCDADSRLLATRADSVAKAQGGPAPHCVQDFRRALDDRSVDALVIATEWEQFRALDLPRLKEIMACPVIVDLRNVYRPAEMTKLGFIYESIGRGGAKTDNRMESPTTTPPKRAVGVTRTPRLT